MGEQATIAYNITTLNFVLCLCVLIYIKIKILSELVLGFKILSYSNIMHFSYKKKVCNTCIDVITWKM